MHAIRIKNISLLPTRCCPPGGHKLVAPREELQMEPFARDDRFREESRRRRPGDHRLGYECAQAAILPEESEGIEVRKRSVRASEDLAEYYDRRGVLSEIEDEPVEFALDEDLRNQILKGMRTRRLQNISIKLDPAQIQALRKIATMKSIPYQTFIRQWLAEGIRRELGLGSK